MQKIVRSVVSCFVMSISLLSCTSSATNTGSEPLPASSSEAAGVTLLLVPTHTSNGCCRVFTMNPGRADVTVSCSLVALNPAGRLIYAGVIPRKAPGHLRSSGFVAPPGRSGHGLLHLPIDVALDHYTALCRPAAWHGSAPI